MSDTEYKQILFKENIMNYFEQQVILKRNKLRKIKHNEYKIALAPGSEVVARETYLDRQIEKLGLYFSTDGANAWEKGIVALVDEVWKLHKYKHTKEELYEHYIDKMH